MSSHSSHYPQEVLPAQFSLNIRAQGWPFINSFVINLKNFEGIDWCMASVNLFKQIMRLIILLWVE